MLTGGQKVERIAAVASTFPELRTFVETGLWQGRGSGQLLADTFARRIVVDIQLENIELARPDYDEALCGDSGIQLRDFLLNEMVGNPYYLDEPCFFWLDAHYVETIDNPAVLAEHPCPLLVELEAICKWAHAAGSVVLIDDTYLFGSEAFPSSAEIHGLIDRYRLWPNVLEKDGILHLYPGNAYVSRYPWPTP